MSLGYPINFKLAAWTHQWGRQLGQQGIRCHEITPFVVINDLIVPSSNNSYGHYGAMKKKETIDSSLSVAG